MKQLDVDVSTPANVFNCFSTVTHMNIDAFLSGLIFWSIYRQTDRLPEFQTESAAYRLTLHMPSCAQK